MKKLIVSIFILGSFSASAGCVQAYKDNFEKGAVSATLGVFIITLPIAIRYGYLSHQSRKMMELIKEAKQSRVGKRTKGLMKSLNGLKSSKLIHKRVLANNKVGKFCRRTNDPSSSAIMDVVPYRTFKNSLRVEIDLKRMSKGLNPIWSEKD